MSRRIYRRLRSTALNRLHRSLNIVPRVLTQTQICDARSTIFMLHWRVIPTILPVVLVNFCGFTRCRILWILTYRGVIVRFAFHQIISSSNRGTTWAKKVWYRCRNILMFILIIRGFLLVGLGSFVMEGKRMLLGHLVLLWNDRLFRLDVSMCGGLSQTFILIIIIWMFSHLRLHNASERVLLVRTRPCRQIHSCLQQWCRLLLTTYRWEIKQLDLGAFL